MDKATPFVDYPGLEMLQSDNVTRDFQARSQTARRIRQALGKGKCVVVHACTTSYDEQFRDPNDLTFGPLISYPDQTVQPQSENFALRPLNLLVTTLLLQILPNTPPPYRSPRRHFWTQGMILESCGTS